MTAPDAFASAFFDLPLGTFTGRAHGQRYVVTRQVMAGGKAHKLVAHQMGGKDYISLNLYQTRSSGLLLRPCEMPARKVTEFVIALRPEA